MISLMSFLFLLFLLPPTSATLTPEAGVVESLGSLKSLLSLCCFFFLLFLAFSEGLGSVKADAGVEIGPLPRDLSPQYIAPWV